MIDNGNRFFVKDEEGRERWFTQEQYVAFRATLSNKHDNNVIKTEKTFSELKAEYKELTGKNPRPIKREQLEEEVSKLKNKQ